MGSESRICCRSEAFYIGKFSLTLSVSAGMMRKEEEHWTGMLIIWFEWLIDYAGLS